MIKSMTGFGSATFQNEDYEISVDLKSVNHRYCEIYIKMPSNYSDIEDELRKIISETFNRGKFECYVKIACKSGDDIDVSLNEKIVEKYVGAINELEKEYHLKNNIKISHIIDLPGVFNIIQSKNDDENLRKNIIESLKIASNELLSMRIKEGEKLSEDIDEKLENLILVFQKIEEKSDDLVEKNLEKLKQKMSDLLQNTNYDENRIITEAGILADRESIDEEIVRFKSHINQFRDMLKSNEPVGRKMDFLIQEMNREINTIGSKTQDLDTVANVVNLKSMIEKIREQIQNIE
ncbi:MAG: YicC/YloC family endoribonuclease [Clostridia bacterium]|nr:YicC/YloC family endoribonuclease [Clostridia bacterium]